MGDRTPDGAVWAAILYPRETAKLHALVPDLRMPLFQRDDMVAVNFSQSFMNVLEVVAGDNVILNDLWISATNWCSLICNSIVLFQWLFALVDPYGDVLWHKLEAVQLGYESLEYIGKRQVNQRWEETSEYRNILHFLGETGGLIEVE